MGGGGGGEGRGERWSGVGVGGGWQVDRGFETGSGFKMTGR